MNTINIKDIKEITSYDKTFFDNAANFTAIRQRPNGEYYRANFERGMLLYYLVQKIKPRKVLELGTGRGYACVAMCKSADSINLSCIIDTVDVVKYLNPQPWLTKNGMQNMSLKELIKKAYPKSISRIKFFTGNTKMIGGWNKMYDLVYIDAGHTYEEVRVDWMNVRRLISKDAVVVFDDYKPNDFGVKRLVDGIDKYNKTFIIMDRQIFPEDRKDYKVDYGQVIVTKRKNEELF